MNNYPEFAKVKNRKYKINTDYRIALKCNEIAESNVLDEERALAIIYLLYGDKGLDNSEDWNDLLAIALKYLNCGKKIEENDQEANMSIGQDWGYIQASFFSDYNIDLSKIIFIATANDISAIPSPLRDRMEFIELSSYTPNEKFAIAQNYLIPDERAKHGLKASELSISKDACELIISEYTRESGVRNLRRKIAEICRKSVKKLLLSDIKKVSISSKNLSEFLDKKVYEIEKQSGQNAVGQVNGLAWTAVGGEVLKIEAIKIKGKGQLTLTGSMGDVMKESAQIAFSVVKTLIDSGKVRLPKHLTRKLKANIYDIYNIHLHIPDGATPKDGPSAGITMCVALASVFSEKKVRSDVAMTGEVDLVGKVLPIGGLKEKLISAYKADIKTALIPAKNYERDLKDIPLEVRENLNIIAVSDISEVLGYTLI